MTTPLYITFLLHMHQPYYKDSLTGEFSMPWVRLHATKDYLDMAEMLRDFPTLHQTFNLVPSLLSQLEDYARDGLNTKDKFLTLSKKPAHELTDEEKDFILYFFFFANEDIMIKPLPRYYDLLIKRGRHMTQGELA